MNPNDASRPSDSEDIVFLTSSELSPLMWVGKPLWAHVYFRVLVRARFSCPDILNKCRKHIKHILCSIHLSYVLLLSGAAFEGGKWGDRPRSRSWRGPALQAYEFVKLYSPVNWKCWYTLRLKSFFKVKFRCVVLGCLLYRNRHNQCLR